MDAYDQDDIDDNEQYSEMEVETRLLAEARMDRRDRGAGGARRGGGAGARRQQRGAWIEDDGELDSDEAAELLTRRRRRHNYDDPEPDDDAGEDGVSALVQDARVLDEKQS